MSLPFSASEIIVRLATRCSLPPVPGLEALPNVGLALALAPVLVLALTLILVLVLAGEIGEIPE
jgi:hypothetical protein